MSAIGPKRCFAAMQQNVWGWVKRTRHRQRLDSPKLTLLQLAPQSSSFVLSIPKLLLGIEASDLFVGQTGTLCHSTANRLSRHVIANVKNWIV
jgi:hypothetical protein